MTVYPAYTIEDLERAVEIPKGMDPVAFLSYHNCRDVLQCTLELICYGITGFFAGEQCRCHSGGQHDAVMVTIGPGHFSREFAEALFALPGGPCLGLTKNISKACNEARVWYEFGFEATANYILDAVVAPAVREYDRFGYDLDHPEARKPQALHGDPGLSL